jgi:hypothetical protein
MRWALPALLIAYATLHRLGQTYGSTFYERHAPMPGDGIVPKPRFVITHGITIDAPPKDIWPWLVQMGWHRGGWYTARWVDKLLFPANQASVDHIIDRLQDLRTGKASIDWTWVFSVVPLDSGDRTRFIFRWRAATKPWWLTLSTWAVIVPADFVMSRDMLQGVKR